MFKPQSLEWPIIHDEFFTSRLQLFSKLYARLLVFLQLVDIALVTRVYFASVSDTNSFSLSLDGRRNRAFYSFRQLCQFLLKVGRRCIDSADLPSENNFKDILDLDLARSTALSVPEFLGRIQLGKKLEQACKIKAEKEFHELKQKNKKLTMKSLVAKTKDNFGRLSRSYVTHLLKGTRSHFDFTTDIGLGLGSFDSEILLNFPIALASMFFSKLYMTFRLHGYLVLEQESQALDAELSFVDEIIITYAEFDQPKLLITDTIVLCSDKSLCPHVLCYCVVSS